MRCANDTALGSRRKVSWQVPPHRALESPQIRGHHSYECLLDLACALSQNHYRTPQLRTTPWRRNLLLHRTRSGEMLAPASSNLLSRPVVTKRVLLSKLFRAEPQHRRQRSANAGDGRAVWTTLDSTPARTPCPCSAAAVVLSAAFGDRVRATLRACVASWPARLLLGYLADGKRDDDVTVRGMITGLRSRRDWRQAVSYSESPIKPFRGAPCGKTPPCRW